MASKLETRVRNLQKQTHNKQCFDCLKTGLQSSVVFPFGIFVCTNCSGLHRQFPSHSVATISMANFTERQVKILEDNGNENARKQWLATWTPSAFSRDPSTLTAGRVSDFIRMCFEEKRWVNKGGDASHSTLATTTGSQSRLTVNPNLQHESQMAINTPMSTSGASTLRRPTQSYQPTPTRANPIVHPQQQQQQQQQQQHVAPSPANQQIDLFDTSIASPSAQTQSSPATTPVLFGGAGGAPAAAAPRPTSYANIVFQGAVQPSTFTEEAVGAMKAISKVMASVIVQYNLSATDFYEVCETAGQLTANAWAQREAKQGNTTPSLSVNMAVLPPASSSDPSKQYQQPQPQQQQQQSRPPTGSTTTLNNMFANMSVDTQPVQPQQPQQPLPQQQQQQQRPPVDMFATMASQPSPQQQPPQQQQQQPAFGGSWDFAQPSPRAGPQSASSNKSSDDMFGDLVKNDPAPMQLPPHQQQQQQPQQRWGGSIPQQPNQPIPQIPQQQPQQQHSGMAQPYFGVSSPHNQPSQHHQQMGMGQGYYGMPQQQPMNMSGGGNYQQQQQQYQYPQQQQQYGAMNMPNFQQQPQQQQPQQPTFDDIDLPF